MEVPVYQLVPRASIVRNEDQPRETFNGIPELAASIAENGLLQPITVRMVGGGRFEIIAGERRFRAITQLAWDVVPCMVVADADDRTAYELAVLENMAREDMNPLEEARALKKLLDLGMDATEVERKVGYGDCKGQMVAWKVSLLDCIEEVQHLVSRGQFTETKAAQLAKLTRNGQLKVMRLFQQKPMTNREFTVLTQAVWAEENQMDMFAETKVSPEAKAAADTLTKALDSLAKAAAQLGDVKPEQLGHALAHRAELAVATIDEVIRVLTRVKRGIHTETGRQLVAKLDE